MKEMLEAKVNLKVLGLLDLEQDADSMQMAIQRLIDHVKKSAESDFLLKSEREKNRALTSEHSELNDTLITLSSKMKSTLQSLKKDSRRLQERVFFLKQLNEAVELSEILTIIREESKRVKGLGDPILVNRHGGRSQVLFFNNRIISEKKFSKESLTESGWRQELANFLGRPIGTLLRVESQDSKVTLLFEHQLEKSIQDSFEKEWSELLGAVSVSIERLRLDQDLREASFFWEKTFDGLDEPIGILDPSDRLIRANRSLVPELLEDLKKDVVRHKGKVYSLQKFPISFGQSPLQSAIASSKVIHFSDQTVQVQLKQHMIQTEKIAALGQLAGNIAHELNNPLTGIRSLCQLLMTDKNTPELQLEDLKEVEKASERCQKIIINLLEYSKPNALAQEELTDVNELVLNTLPFLKTLIGTFRRDIDLSKVPLWTMVDPHLLQQVVFNIVANASYAMGEKGTLSIRSKKVGEWVEIEIQDSGPGIPTEIREQIFDPFFTTKPKGEGTGLGLSFSRNFLRSCGGDLILTSPPGGGSVFKIQLPLRTK